MAVQLDPNGKDDLKTQFATREGTYRLMTLSEYSRPNRVGYQTNQNNPQVRVSLVTLPPPPQLLPLFDSNINIGAAGSCVGNNYQTQQIINNSSVGSFGGGVTTITNSSIANASTSGGNVGTSLPQQQQPPPPPPPTLSSSSTSSTIINNSATNTNNLHHLHHHSNDGGDGLQMSSMAQPLLQSPISNGGGGGDRICFNFGKELYVYAYRGCKKITADLSKPIDKKLYKGTNPSCHDFNETVAVSDGAPLIVGFTTGQIQLVQPGKRETGRLYNEERFIDKSKVTCLKWLPKSPNLFLASHASGHLYLYNEELPCTPSQPNYQLFKSGDGYTIWTCKAKSTRNPMYKWTFGNEQQNNGCINEFAFSPCGLMLAIVSQDGFLRVFNYDKMELLGVARSYFGGFLCVCWSPDGKYIVVGGEDDLVTVWSLNERRVVARGQGHRSWVSVVAFDPFTSYTNWDGPDFSDDENPMPDIDRGGQQQYNKCFPTATTTNDHLQHQNLNHHHHNNSDLNVCDGDKQQSGSISTTIGSASAARRSNSASFRDSTTVSDKLGTSYRLGSVGQDTQLCLWDITEDVLRQSHEIRQRLSSHDPQLNGRGDFIKSNASLNKDTSTNSKSINITSSSSVSTATAAAVNLVKDSVDGSNFSSNSNKGSNISTKSSLFSSASGGSKFSTLNCVSNSGSGGGGGGGSGAGSGDSEQNSFNENSNKQQIGNNLSIGNNSPSINNSGGDNSLGTLSSSITTTGSGGGGGSSFDNDKTKSNNETTSSSSSSNSSGLTAFNSITQRLSNFSFGGSDSKKSSDSHHNHHHHHHHYKKPFTFSKSTGNHTGILHSNSTTTSVPPSSSSSTSNHQHHSTATIGSGGGGDTATKYSSKNNTNLNNKSIVPSYDPMQLIGTSICPRFDECPLLEPLVCKKIAHERLTALIFREDCFLTACQDGFIYTWARPGYSNIPQHNMSSSSPGGAPPGGTVV